MENRTNITKTIVKSALLAVICLYPTQGSGEGELGQKKASGIIRNGATSDSITQPQSKPGAVVEFSNEVVRSTNIVIARSKNGMALWLEDGSWLTFGKEEIKRSPLLTRLENISKKPLVKTLKEASE